MRSRVERFIMDPIFEAHLSSLSTMVQNEPPGYEESAEGKRLVRKLNNSLYGLKQSGRNWYAIFHKLLASISTNQLQILVYSSEMMNYLFYLFLCDDIFLATKHNATMNNLEDSLKLPSTSLLFSRIQFTQNSGEYNVSKYL